jgi:hypothetical protein
MTTPVIARWENLRSLGRLSKGSFTAFSPYYSPDGLKLIETSVPRTARIEFWTRLSLRDWAAGAADPLALSRLMDFLSKSQRDLTLFVNPRLHAKAYFADVTHALVGSANLTNGGFSTNVELMLQLEGKAAAAALETLKVASSPLAKSISAAALSEWVRKYSAQIERAKRQLRKGLQLLDDMQPDSDAALGVSEQPTIDPTHGTLQSFIAWLKANRHLPGAAYLTVLHSDKVVQRRQGHVKQCFSGVFRFLQEYPSWIQRLAAAAVSPDGIVEPDEWLLRDWSEHLARHAADVTDLYSYATLRALLRPNLGGVLPGAGGGASGTLKRVFPLVALFMKEQIIRKTKP